MPIDAALTSHEMEDSEFKGVDNVVQGHWQGTADITTSSTNESNTAALHDGTDDGRKAFLATFTADEDKAIMRKVDMRFLWLIGITYLIKNSEAPRSILSSTAS